MLNPYCSRFVRKHRISVQFILRYCEVPIRKQTLGRLRVGRPFRILVEDEDIADTDVSMKDVSGPPCAIMG